MSYTTSNDFLLINKISTETMYENLLKKDKILLEIHGDETDHLTHINEYFNNLLNKNIIDITINNLFNNKILYYNNSDKYPDTYVIDNNKTKLYNIIDIDNSFYASESVKKYMFLYDFLAEYYRNLAIIKKNKYAIDNKSLYEHTFEMKIRYKYKSTFSGGSTIVNINNDDKDLYYYVISFKLEDQKSKDSTEDILIQPTGFITELNINDNTFIDDHKTLRELTDSEKENFLQSFRDLFNKIIIKENLTVDSELSYYHLLSNSYKFKFHKLLLSYYISKTIYFYFKTNYKTKIKEIDTIINQYYPIAFENFNKIINNSTPESLISIMKNSEKKQYVHNNNKEKELNKINYLISKLNIEKENILSKIRKNGTNYSETKLTQLQNRFDDITTEINKLELNYQKISDKDYITRESGQIQEAIEYKSKLHKYNQNIGNNAEKIKEFQNKRREETKYINNLDITNYFIVFLLIIIIFTFILDYSTAIINISIPITLFAITIVLYLVINYAIKNRFHGNINSYEFSANQSVIQSLYNTIGGKYVENFEEETTSAEGQETVEIESEEISEIELDPIVQDIVDNNLVIGSNELYTTTADGLGPSQLDNLLDSKINADIEQKIYITIPSTSYKIDIINEMIEGTDVSTTGLNYSHFWTGWPASTSSDGNQNMQVLKTYDEGGSGSDQKIIAFVNDQNKEETTHTIYTFNIPEGVDYFHCQVLVVGGGSFGGHIARQADFDDVESGSLPSVKNMGEGGAGGAVILQNLDLRPGKYELGVGRGGYWIGDNLERSITEGQAGSSYIKNIKSGEVYVLAKGALYEKYSSSSLRQERQFNQQISGGKISGNKSSDLGNVKNGPGTLGVKNDYSNGGRGGLIKPADGQVGFTYLDQLGDKVDTYYLSSHRYETEEESGTNGNDGYDASSYFGTSYNNGIFAAGGGAASYCRDGEDTTFHEVEGKWYTCSSSVDRAGIGGNGGGGKGSSMDFGYDGVHGSGSGGGGGKTIGGDGGAGIILLKFNIEDMREKISKRIESTKLKLKQAIYEIGVSESNAELRRKKLEIAEHLREINNDKAEIAAKYEQIGVLIEVGETQQETIDGFEELARQYDRDQRLLKAKIQLFNTQIDDYNQSIARLSTEGDIKRSELSKITTEFEINKAKFIKQEKTVQEKEKEERLKQTDLAEHRAEYLKNIANRLKAEACKKAFRVAQLQKSRDLLALRREGRELRKEAMEEAERQRIQAIQETIAAEKARDQALNDQYEAEQEYKAKKKELYEAEKDAEILPADQPFTISFRLEIDFRIAGIHGYDDGFFEGVDEANIEQMRRSLEKEKIKRENFVTNIIKELTYATSDIIGTNDVAGTLPNRYSILRIHSGNLERREEIETAEEAEERRKLKIISNFEKSAFDNEFNKRLKESVRFERFTPFNVTEHFVVEEQTEDELLFRTRTQGYVPPDNVMVIEMQILPHPKSYKPYAIDIVDELVLQANRLDSKLRTASRYFRFLNAYKIQDQDWVLVKRGRGIVGNVDILQNNKDTIDKINSNFGIIKNLQTDLPSYYDNVNPLLKREVKVYNDKNYKTNIYNKLSNEKINNRFIDIRKRELTINFVLSLCVLITITSILLKFINNPIIFIIFIGIFICLLVYYIYNISRIVNTKYKKNYWLKPRQIKFINASNE